MLQEFKKFALRGNVVDLAIGVIIGAAFGKIVDSLVDRCHHADHRPHLRRPRFQQLLRRPHLGGVSQAPTYDAAKKAGATLGYGQFITVAVNFIIIAWVMFLVIKGMNTLFKQGSRTPRRRPRRPRRKRSC